MKRKMVLVLVVLLGLLFVQNVKGEGELALLSVEGNIEGIAEQSFAVEPLIVVSLDDTGDYYFDFTGIEEEEILNYVHTNIPACFELYNAHVNDFELSFYVRGKSDVIIQDKLVISVDGSVVQDLENGSCEGTSFVMIEDSNNVIDIEGNGDKKASFDECNVEVEIGDSVSQIIAINLENTSLCGYAIGDNFNDSNYGGLSLTVYHMETYGLRIKKLELLLSGTSNEVYDGNLDNLLIPSSNINNYDQDLVVEGNLHLKIKEKQVMKQEPIVSPIVVVPTTGVDQ